MDQQDEDSAAQSFLRLANPDIAKDLRRRYASRCLASAAVASRPRLCEPPIRCLPVGRGGERLEVIDL